MKHPGRGKVPPVFKGIYNSIRKKAKRRGISLRFSATKTVHSDDIDSAGSSGYFSLAHKELAVATGNEFSVWIGVLLHESCHMDQEFDKKVSIEKLNHWTYCSNSMWAWMSGKLQLNSRQLDSVIAGVVEMEKDCEMRTVELIRKWKLPMSISEYTKAANLYLYCHQLYKEQRRYFSVASLNHPTLMKHVPDTFQDDYTKIPRFIRAYIAKHVD